MTEASVTRSCQTAPGRLSGRKDGGVDDDGPLGPTDPCLNNMQYLISPRPAAQPDYVFDSHNMYILYLISFSPSHEELPHLCFSSSSQLPVRGRVGVPARWVSAAARFYGVWAGPEKTRERGGGRGCTTMCTCSPGREAGQRRCRKHVYNV